MKYQKCIYLCLLLFIFFISNVFAGSNYILNFYSSLDVGGSRYGKCIDIEYEFYSDRIKVDIKWNTYCFQSEYVKILIEKNQYIKTILDSTPNDGFESFLILLKVNISEFRVCIVDHYNTKHCSDFIKITDDVKPTGEIYGIKNSYNIGDIISYSIKGWDNNSLYKLNFTVKNSSGITKHKKEWYVSGTSVSKFYSFNTNGWKPGTYYYALWVKDAAENAKEYPGQFTISDTVKPTGQVSGINSSYNQGNITIYYTAKGYDNYKYINTLNSK